MVDFALFPRGIPFRHERDNISPNATWLAPENVTEKKHWQYEDGKIFLGKLGKTFLGVTDNRHMVTIAGSRAGKGTSAIIPNLIVYPGSILCIDPKGENAWAAAEQRASMGQKVFVLDPFLVSGCDGGSFNPLDMIDVDHPSCVDDAALIADALIVQESKEESYWVAAARNWLRGLILYICARESPETRNLITLRTLLSLNAERQKILRAEMMKSDAAYGVIARAAGALDQKAEKELSGVLSTAIEQTEFLDSPYMRRVLERSDFRLTDLKGEKITIFLCLPAMRMATHSRWLRIFINLTIEAMERRPAPPADHDVLLILDEFPTLGYLEALEKAAGLIAGYGVRLWTIIQDLSQLQKHYKESWETFIGNAGLLQAFGNADHTTLKYLSDKLGQTTVLNISRGEISLEQASMGFSGENLSMSVAPLMTPDEIGYFFSRQKGTQLLLWAGSNPIAADRVNYFEPGTIFEGKFRNRRE